MGNEVREPASFRFILIAAALVIVIAGMRAASPVLIPFLLSIFIAVISGPLLFWLQAKRIPTVLALLIVIGGVIIIALGIAALVGTSIDDFSRAVPGYQKRLQEMTSGTLDWLKGKGIAVPEQGLGESFDPGAAMELVA